MYGIEAITSQNGWAMAMAGIFIVFSGLALLSTTIAQFHKLISFWEDRDLHYQRFASRRTKQAAMDTANQNLEISSNLRASARQFKLITNRIGEPFSLPKLLKLAELSGLQHPHSTLNDLVQTGLIVPDKKGYFVWK